MLGSSSSGTFTVVIIVLLLLGVVFLGRILQFFSFRWYRGQHRETPPLQDPPAAAPQSGIILPPARRAREESSTRTVIPPAERLPVWRRLFLLPMWITVPLVWLGGYFLVFMPLGPDWGGYVTAIVIAVGIGVWTARNHRSVILRRGDRSAVIWVRWGRRARDDAQQPPVLVPPAG
jgi:hypothetical protein